MRQLPDVYNGVVWTESALNYLRAAPAFSAAVSRLHQLTKVQIVLAPGTSSSCSLKLFNGVQSPTVILALDTTPASGGIKGFPRYCATTLTQGVKEIHDFAREVSERAVLGNLGALIPSRDLPIEAAQRARPKDEGGVLWLAVEAVDHIFVGPELPSLAEQVLIHYGVSPERTLWLCSLPSDRKTTSVDFRVLLRRNQVGKIHPVHVGPVAVPKKLRKWLVGTPFIELAGTSVAAQLDDLSKAHLFQPIRLHWDCDLLRSREIFQHLGRFRELARTNNGDALSILKIWYEKNLTEVEKQWFPTLLDTLSIDGSVFDNKSGAIAFDSYEWENDLRRRCDADWKEVVQYFDDKPGGQWQSDRPNL